jgi:hypothetical protein
MQGATPEQLNELARPIPRRLIKRGKRGKEEFDYITARTVMNMLDYAVGRANWQTSYRIVKPAQPLTVECTLSICIDGEWVGKADVGTEENFSPEKAAYSNALKRAGAQWGIGRELYGEGNVYEEDDASIDPATGEVVAAPPSAPEIDDVVWTRNAERLNKFMTWCESLWPETHPANLNNRIAVALGLPTPGGNRDTLVATIRKQYTGSPDDAMRAIENYQPGDKSTPAAS